MFERICLLLQRISQPQPNKQDSQEQQKTVDNSSISFCRSSAKRQVKTSQDDTTLCQLQLSVNKSQMLHKFSPQESSSPVYS